MLKVYRNSAIFAILLIAGIQWGFYKNYTSEFPNFIDKTTTIHVHGALLMTWMLLLIVQPLLIKTGRIHLHRTIGKVSYVLGPLIILFLFLIGKGSYWRSIGKFPEHDILRDIVLDARGLLFIRHFLVAGHALQKRFCLPHAVHDCHRYISHWARRRSWTH